MRVFIIFCFSILFLHNGFSQSTDQLIKKIQNQKMIIDVFVETADYQKVSFQDESGKEFELVIYMSNQLPVKLMVTNIVSSRKKEKAFYFDEFGLIYVEVIQTIFQRTPRWEEAKSPELGETEQKASIEKIEKSYFYFKDEKIIDWSSDSSISNKTASIRKMESQLIEEMKDLMSKLR